MVSKSYDFRVDNKITVGNFVKTIVKDIANLCADTTILSYSNEVVLFSDLGAMPRQKTLADMHVHSGDRLLLL